MKPLSDYNTGIHIIFILIVAPFLLVAAVLYWMYGQLLYWFSKPVSAQATYMGKTIGHANSAEFIINGRRRIFHANTLPLEMTTQQWEDLSFSIGTRGILTTRGKRFISFTPLAS